MFIGFVVDVMGFYKVVGVFVVSVMVPYESWTGRGVPWCPDYSCSKPWRVMDRGRF